MDMLIINRVPELVAAKFGGMDKVNMSDVQRDTGLSYPTVTKWVKNRVDRVDFGTLEVWCRYLERDVCDVLAYIPDDRQT
jgi:DNA-binding Xre family transcriptional regulator